MPVHVSATSQTPALARHVVVDGANTFAGQLGVPLHDSAGSHTPVLGRHTTAAPRLVQVPLALAPAATEHAWQSPAHAALQQKPSTQLPPTHWVFREHAAPTARRGTHFRGFCVVSQ